MRKQPIGKWIKDRIILVVLAIVIGISLESLLFFLKDDLKLSDGWVSSIVFSLFSIVIANYYSFPIIRKKTGKIILFALLNSLLALEIAFVFLLFYLNLVELPERHTFVYSFGFAGMGFFTVEIFSAIVDKLSERKSRSNFNSA